LADGRRSIPYFSKPVKKEPCRGDFQKGGRGGGRIFVPVVSVPGAFKQTDFPVPKKNCFRSGIAPRRAGFDNCRFRFWVTPSPNLFQGKDPQCQLVSHDARSGSLVKGYFPNSRKHFPAQDSRFKLSQRLFSKKHFGDSPFGRPKWRTSQKGISAGRLAAKGGGQSEIGINR